MSETTREDLINYCDSHGLKYHGNAGFNTLKDIVDEHKASLSDLDGAEPEEVDVPEPKEPETEDKPKPTKSGGNEFKNVGKNKHSVAGKILEPGDKVALTQKQTEDKLLMAKIKTAIRCGNLKAV